MEKGTRRYAGMSIPMAKFVPSRKTCAKLGRAGLCPGSALCFDGLSRLVPRMDCMSGVPAPSVEEMMLEVSLMGYFEPEVYMFDPLLPGAFCARCYDRPIEMCRSDSERQTYSGEGGDSAADALADLLLFLDSIKNRR